MKKPTATIQRSAVCEELLVMWEAGGGRRATKKALGNKPVAQYVKC
jgi:hypothetical protein